MGTKRRSLEFMDRCLCSRGGHLEMLQWLRSQGCPWDKRTCAHAAAGGGHLEVLQWLRSEGYPWDEMMTCSFAAVENQWLWGVAMGHQPWLPRGWRTQSRPLLRIIYINTPKWISWSHSHWAHSQHIFHVVNSFWMVDGSSSSSRKTRKHWHRHLILGQIITYKITYSYLYN